MPRSNGCCTSKDIAPGQEVVLYGDGSEDVSAVRTRLEELGHTGVRTYEHRWSGWAADETLPVERLPNYDKLVHTEWLRQVLDGDRPEAAPAGHFLVFHVNFGVPEEYEEDHLPGALYLDTNQLENPAGWNRRMPEELDQPCARSESRTTRRSSSMAATPRGTPTRSGQAVGRGRSRPPARR